MLSNAKEEKYCQARASGKSQRKAYLEAFPSARKWKDSTVDSKACNLEKTEKISARLKELIAENGQNAKLKRSDLLDKLEDIIYTKHVQFKSNDIIRAIDLYAEICGYKNMNDENIEDVSDAESDVFGND